MPIRTFPYRISGSILDNLCGILHLLFALVFVSCKYLSKLRCQPCCGLSGKCVAHLNNRITLCDTPCWCAQFYQCCLCVNYIVYSPNRLTWVCYWLAVLALRMFRSLEALSSWLFVTLASDIFCSTTVLICSRAGQFGFSLSKVVITLLIVLIWVLLGSNLVNMLFNNSMAIGSNLGHGAFLCAA